MISVAMASYNGEKYIQEQIESIMNQTEKVDELVVVDDHSSDQTVPTILHLAHDHPEWNIKVTVNTQNLGYKKNFKKAISLTKGDYIFLCDQDDVWLENKVEEMMKIMKKNPQIQVLASSFDLIDGDGKPLAIEEKAGRSNHNLLLKEVEPDSLNEMTFEEFVYHNYFQGCATLMTRKVKEEFLAHFNEILPHDWLINMIAAKNQGMYFYNHSLFQYRIHEKNTIGMVGEINPTFRQKWALMNNLEVRKQFAQERVDSLSVVEMIDPQFFYAHPEYVKMKKFCQEHCEYLEHKRFFKLLFQNRNPLYKELKTNKARLYDLAFTLDKFHQ